MPFRGHRSQFADGSRSRHRVGDLSIELAGISQIGQYIVEFFKSDESTTVTEFVLVNRFRDLEDFRPHTFMRIRELSPFDSAMR